MYGILFPGIYLTYKGHNSIQCKRCSLHFSLLHYYPKPSPSINILLQPDAV
jgi:hypothetical protein